LSGVGNRLKSLQANVKRAAVAAGQAYDSQLRKQFAMKVDPYGTPWAPHRPATVKRWGVHPLLRLTGAMRNSFRVSVNGLEIIATMAPPAWRHQVGSAYMAARPVFPTKGLSGDGMSGIRLAVQKAMRK
jgi:Phage virion morphogenesis family